VTILFLLGATSRIRNFDRAIVALADEGHTLRLTGRPRKGAFALPSKMGHPRISGVENPTERVDAWRDVVDLLRGARDYVRYFDPRFAAATRIVRRAHEIAPAEFVLFCERHPWVRRRWRLVSRFLALCEDLIPPDPGFEAFVREQQPDLILVTPLVTFESYQTDYVKIAHRLGIPIAFLPFSWDNLTNKGLMRILPDRVLVWNDTQAREAIELHGVPPDRVVVTGAARFDDFFERRPATTRDEFLAGYGLEPNRPMVLYLGSSQLTGPNEMELIQRWVESLRASDDEVLRGCNILIRPHPALMESWVDVDMSAHGRVGISRQASRKADQHLFDSLSHAHAAVGLNTSAMLEAGIVGRPVHTLLIPGFDEGQRGTMHFQYLVEAHGGLATVARDLPEHLAQLAGVLRQPPAVVPGSRRFVEGFLRPHGIDKPVWPIMAAEMARAGSIVKRPRRAPMWHFPVRTALLAWLRRRAVAAATADVTIVGSSLSLRPVRTALEELQRGTAPIFVGPWNDSIAHEVLYWIPFVHWAVATYNLAPERLIVLSRGGVQAWYGELGTRYLDAPTLFSAAEWEHWLQRSIPQSRQNPKQAAMFPFDQDIVDRAAKAFDLSEFQVLHPLAFFRVWGRLHTDRAMEQLRDVLRPTPLVGRVSPPFDQAQDADNPASYAVMSMEWTEALPDTTSNQRILQDAAARLAAAQQVVTLQPSSAPAEQARLLAGATEFAGGYGDLAVLASFCGTAATAFHSEPVPAEQLDVLRQVCEPAGWGRITVTPVDSRVEEVGRE
jgi:hypothetical protein